MYGPDYSKIHAIHKARELQEERNRNYNKAKEQGREAGKQEITSELEQKLRNQILKQIKDGKIEEIKLLEARKIGLETSLERCREQHTFVQIPRNEFETELLFLTYAHHFGFYDFVRNKFNKFPDYFAKKDGKKCTIELEYLSGFFIAHKHNPAEADWLVCWRHSTKQRDKLPANIIELKSELSEFYSQHRA